MRKASLSLSMNALVILILAITILGLALGFVRGVFTKMEAKVKAAVSSTEISNPPTTDNPITVTPFKVEIKQGDVGEVVVAFMNVEPETSTYYLNITDTEGLSCKNCINCTKNCTVPMDYSTVAYSLKAGQINTWTVIFSPVSGVSATPFGTYLYTANVRGPDELRFTKDVEVVIQP